MSTTGLLQALTDRQDPVRSAMRLVVNHIAAARSRPFPWPEPPSLAAAPHLIQLGDTHHWGAHELGQVYTELLPTTQRDEHGVYYTPPPIADAMAQAALAPRLVDHRTVRVWDPACGAGVFLEAAAHTLAGKTEGIRPRVIGAALYGTDTDPIAVDLTKAALWLASDGTRPLSWLDGNITVADPLTGAAPPHLGDHPEGLVILGNPPYRDKAKGAAPWIEAPRTNGEPAGTRPSMDEFRTPGSRTGYTLANLNTYFWRLCLWRAFETRPGPAVVALLTPSAFLASHAYKPMRAMIRHLADEAWFIDLTPEGHQPPIGTRLFPGVQLPLAITVLARHHTTNPNRPAHAQHHSVNGTAEEKTHQVRAACAHLIHHPPPQEVTPMEAHHRASTVAAGSPT